MSPQLPVATAARHARSDVRLVAAAVLVLLITAATPTGAVMTSHLPPPTAADLACRAAAVPLTKQTLAAAMGIDAWGVDSWCAEVDCMPLLAELVVQLHRAISWH